jgi:short-subunit dehydrogenase
VATDINEKVTGMFAEFQAKVLQFVMDVTSGRSINNVRDKLQEKGITVKYLINNAGIFRLRPVSEMDEEDINNIFRVNTFSSVLMVRHFLDDLQKTNGRVIQISSCSVKLPTMFQAYPATKIALEALSVSMRQELSLLGVKLIIVRAGAIDTGLIKDVKLSETAGQSRFQPFYRNFVENAKKDVGKTVPPEDVAAVVRKVITSEKTKLIYTVNRNKAVMFFSMFPQKIIDLLLKRSVSK